VPPARRRSPLLLTAVALAALSPAAATAASVRLVDARLTPRAGAILTVAARVTGERAAVPTACRLLVAGRPGVLGAPRSVRREDPQGRVSWTWRIPLRTEPGRRRVQVRCQGARPAGGLIQVAPAAFVPRIVSRELVERPTTGFPGERGYAYLLRVVNPRPDFDLLDVAIGVDLVGADGTGVATRTIIIERLPARGTLLAGEQVTVIGDEQPSALRVRVAPAEGRYPPRPAATVGALRLVRNADGGELYVRGEVTNPAFRVTRPGDLTIALRAADGRLVDVGTALVSEPVGPGGAVTFDEGFFGAGYLGVTRAEATIDAGR